MTKSKKIIIITLLLIIVMFLIIVVMGIFKICPPIKAGPQPPWCINPEQFSHDMDTAPDFFKCVTPKDLFTSKTQLPESKYQYKKLNYLNLVAYSKKNYSIMMGIGPTDIWGKTADPSGCYSHDNRIGIVSTMSRVKSINSDFVYLNDFRMFASKDLNIVDIDDGGARTITQEEIDNIIKTAKKYDQKVIFNINLYDGSEDNDTKKVFENAIKNADPNIINLLFDRWENEIIKEAKKVNDADYLVITPGDYTFQFMGNYDLQNKRYLDIIKKVKSIFPGKICAMGNKNYLNIPEITFDDKADCAILADDIDEILPRDTTEDINSIKNGWSNYLNDSIVKNNKNELFLSVMMFSYNGSINKGWYEPFSSNTPQYDPDWKEQALVYEALFETLYEQEIPLKGVYSYGYWWSDETYPEVWIHTELSPSFRGKDGETVFYEWSKIISI